MQLYIVDCDRQSAVDFVGFINVFIPLFIHNRSSCEGHFTVF